MFIKDKCPISATPSGSDVMNHIFFYKCLMPVASGCKTVFLLKNFKKNNRRDNPPNFIELVKNSAVIA